MNRIIKFRAWDTKSKIMYQFVKLEEDGSVDFCWNGDEHKVKLTPGGYEEYLDKKRFIPLQFTGLTDKNGKEIYEGDIVNHGDNYPSEVIWDDNNYWLEGPGFATREIGNETVRYHGLPGYTNPIEVIGNIYENKDLLK